MEERNEIYDLVGIEEIAKMGDADLEAARHWVSEDGFPSPIIELPTGARWDRMAVYKYLLETPKARVAAGGLNLLGLSELDQ